MSLLYIDERLQKYSKIIFWINVSSSIIFLILVSIAHYYAIINGYDWQQFELSELVLDSFISKVLFSIACVIEGICLLLLLVPFSLYFQFKKIRIVSLLLSILVCFSLIGVGAFPEDIFLVTHYIFGVSFFISTAVFICFITSILLKYQEAFPKSIIIFGYTTFGIVLFHLITRWFFGMAYTQRLAVLVSMLYLLFLSRKIIFSKNVNENDL